MGQNAEVEGRILVAQGKRDESIKLLQRAVEHLGRSIKIDPARALDQRRIARIKASMP
jgi:hypothetical protein